MSELDRDGMPAAACPLGMLTAASPPSDEHPSEGRPERWVGVASPVASEGDMQTLSHRYARTRDPHARETLILFHQRLVHYVAMRFVGSGETLEDLVGVGNIGLINALDRYDPSREVRFSTYAMPTIVGEIKRHFRDKTWHVKVPRRLQELSLNARKAQQTLGVRLGRPPTVHEIAAELAVPEDAVLEALEVGHIAVSLSLDMCLDPHSGGDGATLMDVIGRSDDSMHDIDAHTDLRRALDALDDGEHQILYLRFFEGLSQARIARTLGVSQMHVSRVQQRALRRLRGLLAEESATQPGVLAPARRIRARRSPSPRPVAEAPPQELLPPFAR